MEQLNCETVSNSQFTDTKVEAAFFCWLLLHPSWILRDNLQDVWTLQDWLYTRTPLAKPKISDPESILSYYNQFHFKSIADIKGLTTLLTCSIGYKSESVQQEIYKWIRDYMISHTQVS